MNAETRPAVLEEVLSRYRDLVAEEIDRQLPRGEPRRWLYEPMSDYPHRAGKALRAALCRASCRAFGGDEQDALAVAAAIELAHCAFLVHDDIQDGSDQRHNRDTVWKLWGSAQGINVGDALYALAQVALAEQAASHPNIGAGLLRLNRTTLVEKIKKKGLRPPDGDEGLMI
mgnify:CR=1 FL=1